MKKKYGLFKILIVLLLLVVVATYFIPNRSGEIQQVAIVDLFFNFIQSFYYFFDTALFILVVGGFYGVLNRIPAYRDIIQGIVNKIGEKGKLFVIVMTIVFALLSSLSGLNLLLLLFVPFVVSIVLLLGYDKLVALSVTVGGILVGLIGGVFVTFKDASNQYAVSYTTFDKMVGLDKLFNSSTILPKVILLIIGTILLVICILNHIKNMGHDDKLQLSKNDVFFVETKEKSTKKSEKTKKKVSSKWPFIVLFSLMTILLILGYLPWQDLFGIDVFTKFHTWLTGLSIGKYKVFTSLISSQITAFGSWGSLGSYLMAIFLLCLNAWLLQIIYRVDFEDAMDGFAYGDKKMIVPAFIAVLAYSLLVSSYNHGFVETIITNAGKSFGDNVIIHSLVTILGSLLNVDLYYVVSGVFTSIVSSLTDKANLSVYAVMFQSLYGLVQLVGPTSILLIAGLCYLEVPYKTWLKYIWRFIVELLIAIFVVLMIVSLL